MAEVQSSYARMVLACNEDSCNNFNGCDLPSNSLYIIDNDILYNSDIAIAGFQFDVDGSIVASVSVVMQN